MTKRQAVRQTDGLTNRQSDSQKGSQADRQTKGQTMDNKDAKLLASSEPF